MARTGRRPGGSGTREAILDAARLRFAEDGYRGATIRSIAAEASVDPALVHHYFGTKQDLFVAVLELPADPDAILATLTTTPTEEIGRRLVETFLRVWDRPEPRQRLQALIRGAMVDDTAARMIREFIVDTLFVPVAEHVAPDRPELRASLVASQMMGFALVRYLLRIEPLASADHEEILAAVAPTVQRYLTGPL